MPASPCSESVRQLLVEARGERCVPGRLRTLAIQIVDSGLALLFPHFARDGQSVEDELDAVCHSLEESAKILDVPVKPENLLDRFPGIREMLLEDARSIEAGDPAAVGLDEVILAYPGFFAIAVHRIAHALHRQGLPLMPRLLAECAHSRTGIDIHPGADIGRRFFIDHGTGLVIGETAVIGDDVKLYQGVTLGALTVDKAHAATKRHPTLEDRVVVYANATILGGNTVVGAGSIIGGNVWLTRSVPKSAVVTHQPDIRVRAPGEETPLDFQI